MLSACVGQFETKPNLTSTCRINWQSQGGIQRLPHSRANKTGLNLLVFNIHDRLLPGSVFGSDGHTEDEVACIGDLASRFDLVLFQEAFVRPAQIARYTGHAWAHHPKYPEGGGGDWWPLRMVCEICQTPGLLMLSQEHPVFVYSEPYKVFAGWNTKLNKADDFFSKGFQLVKFKNFWVLNSHMDSGRGQDSINARAAQFKQITLALKWYVPKNAPLVIGMDSNLHPEKEEQDGRILGEFLQANGLTVVQHRGPDLLAVRNLEVTQSDTLPLKNVLSDHEALSATLFLP